MTQEDMENGPHLVLLDKSVLAQWFLSFTPTTFLWGDSSRESKRSLRSTESPQNTYFAKGRSFHPSVVTRMLLVLLRLA